MSVTLKQFNPKDPDVVQLQQNTADAVVALSKEADPSVVVLSVSSNTKLVGNEDVVLVDASTATSQISLVLPGPRQLKTILTVKVTKTGSQSVIVKATDIPSVITIDGGSSITLQSGSIRVVSDGRNFWTV